MFAASVTGASLYQFLENLSVDFTSPASVSFITALAPVATALVAHFALGESLGRSLFVGMGISLVGVFFISFVYLVKHGVGERYSSDYNKEFLGVCALGVE